LACRETISRSSQKPQHEEVPRVEQSGHRPGKKRLLPRTHKALVPPSTTKKRSCHNERNYDRDLSQITRLPFVERRNSSIAIKAFSQICTQLLPKFENAFLHEEPSCTGAVIVEGVPVFPRRNSIEPLFWLVAGTKGAGTCTITIACAETVDGHS